MRRAGKKKEPEEESGAPEWMVTFSDCMTLLLTFFVLLLSFSSFDDKVFRRLKVIYCEALPGISLFTRSERDALLPQTTIINPEELDRGSEQPTLEEGKEGGLKKETKSEDFQRRRVLLIPSKRVFWGNGTAISSEGHKVMTILASFLKRTQEAVVISENEPLNDKNNGYSGLSRAWAVMEYLTTKQNLDKKRFNISQAGTLPQDESLSKKPSISKPKAERMLEIVLLERSICN